MLNPGPPPHSERPPGRLTLACLPHSQPPHLCPSERSPTMRGVCAQNTREAKAGQPEAACPTCCGPAAARAAGGESPPAVAQPHSLEGQGAAPLPAQLLPVPHPLLLPPPRPSWKPRLRPWSSGSLWPHRPPVFAPSARGKDTAGWPHLPRAVSEPLPGAPEFALHVWFVSIPRLSQRWG